MLDTLLRWCGEHAIDEVYLGTTAKFLAAHRFYEKNGFYARLVALVVSEESHGRGVGAALVRAVERWANQKGAGEIFLNSGVQREGARRFYEKLGYRVTGVRFSKELPAGAA